MKTALITGIRGQDGAYLAQFLLEKGYKVYGADRRSGESTFWRLKELGIENEIEIVYMDLIELTNIYRTIEKIKPDEIYNLAAQSFVGASFEQPILTSDINAMGVLRLLEAIRTIGKNIKFYQASTSEMFGKAISSPQDEQTPFYPRSPYGISKLFAHWATINYRESYNMFNCSGILFNHESPLRGLDFVTRKITTSVAKIKLGLIDKFYIGNLNAKRDWGYAKEYVAGMWLMLQQESPDDYVLATGVAHSVREFIEKAFKLIGIDIVWKGKGIEEKGIDKKSKKVLVEVFDKYYRPADVENLVGNPAKAKKKLGWKAKITFDELINIMLKADIDKILKERK